MTARVHSPRQQQQSTNNASGNGGGGSSGSQSSQSSGKQQQQQTSSQVAAVSAAAAVVAAVARLHQQALSQQQHLYVDEDDSPNPSPCTTPSPGPKLADGRRANKPLMEKRRRARINQSLAALKALILDSARLENTKHSKLEKADILELTVRHLQRQRSLAQPGLSRYKAGYQDCSREVSRYLDAPDIITGNTSPIDPAFKQRLLRHLDSCVSELDLDLGSRPDSGLGSSPGSVTDRVLGPGSPVSALEHQAAAAAAVAAAHCSAAALGAAMIKQEMPELEAVVARPDSSTAPGDENNNSSRPTSAFGHLHPGVVAAAAAMPGIDPAAAAAAAAQANPNMLSVVQVIPSRLPDGQVVFLLPSHYVQLAAAAAANGINIGPNPPAAIWATTNMSLLKATDKLMKRPLMEGDLPPDWPPVDQLKPSKSPRIEPPAEQPLDFTTSKKLKAAARYQQRLDDTDKQQSSSSSTSSSDHTSPPPPDEKPKLETMTTTSTTTTEMMSVDSLEQQAKQQQQQDEEGMWRPW